MRKLSEFKSLKIFDYSLDLVLYIVIEYTNKTMSTSPYAPADRNTFKFCCESIFFFLISGYLES